MCAVGREVEGSRGGRICLVSQTPRKITFLQRAWPVILLGPGFLRLRDQSRDVDCKENRKQKQVS